MMTSHGRWPENEGSAMAVCGGWRESTLRRHEFSCRVCGYGIVCSVLPPKRPMCQAVEAWIEPDRARDAAAARKYVFG